MLSNSTKDSLQIYEYPPKIFPESPKSVSVVMDYSSVAAGNEEELLDTLIKDATLTMYSILYELNKDGIFEIKVYGTRGDKTIFYSRVHKMKLQMNVDFGIYKDKMIKSTVLLNGDRYKKSAEDIGYEFNTEGLDYKYTADELGKNYANTTIGEFVTSKYNVEGKFIGTIMRKDAFLILENFVQYFKLPQIIYSKNPLISKYSFFVFIMNTVIVIGWAMFIQTIMCSVIAFALSRLFDKRTARMVLLFFMGTLMIPFVSIMIPQFIMFKKMGMYNNYAALLVPFLYPGPFAIYLFKGFFDRLPGSLFEAGRIDGASEWFNYTRICIPLSKPIIAVMALQVFLGNWNDFFWAWMVSEKQQLWTLNVALFNLSRLSTIKPNFIMGLSIVTIAPVILLSILFSEQLKRSIASSGIKG
jgi:ABC-type glycerol-3-phosphate transport system permease component